MKPIPVLLLLATLASCSLFQAADATPALVASTEREGIFTRQAEAFAKVIRGATGLDEATRARALEAIAKDVADYGRLASATHELLVEFGDVDWRQIARQAHELYQERRAER